MSIRKMNIMTKICVLAKGKWNNLYKIPYCISQNFCYDIDTKRWYQWSLEPRFQSITWNRTDGFSFYFFRSYTFWTNQKSIPEVIQFLSWEEASDFKKARLTNDVRYQEFNEVTLDWFEAKAKRSRVTSFLYKFAPPGRFFCCTKLQFSVLFLCRAEACLRRAPIWLRV